MQVVRTVVFLFVLAGALGGCQEPVEGLFDPGDPCRSLRTPCLDEERSLQCVEERWEEVSCAEYCAALAPGVVSEGCHENACECVPPEGGCTPQESYCEDSESLVWCTESWTWSTYTCEGVCADLSPQSNSEGCVPANDDTDDETDTGTDHCLCTIEGVECTEGSLGFCTDGTALVECTDGIWAYTECVDICGVETAECQPDAPSGARCEC